MASAVSVETIRFMEVLSPQKGPATNANTSAARGHENEKPPPHEVERAIEAHDAALPHPLSSAGVIGETAGVGILAYLEAIGDRR
jgi:hypothetical protein